MFESVSSATRSLANAAVRLLYAVRHNGMICFRIESGKNDPPAGVGENMNTILMKCIKFASQHQLTVPSKVLRTGILCCMILIGLFVGSHVNAQSVAPQFVHTDGVQIVDANGDDLFLRGINLGNWLLWEGYLMMGDFDYRTHTQFRNSLAVVFGSEAKAEEFEHQWRLNYVDEKAITDLKSLGFNSVRVPFHYDLFWADVGVKNDGFEYLDRVVMWCRTHQIYVLLDMHAAPGYQNPGDHCDNVNSDAKQPRNSVQFWDGDHVEIAAKVWRHIASHYRNEPTIWGYDLINEPVPLDGREFELLPSMITMRNAIREVDTNHIIVAEGSWWGSDLGKLDWTDAKVQAKCGVSSAWDRNLVYQLHHYGPLKDTMGRERMSQQLKIPIILGEYGETDTDNLRATTRWARQNLAGCFPWSFKKMSHDRTLWTIPPNSDYEQLKSCIKHGNTPSEKLYDAMINFAKNNIRNGHSSHQWHQDFYDAIHLPSKKIETKKQPVRNGIRKQQVPED